MSNLRSGNGAFRKRNAAVLGVFRASSVRTPSKATVWEILERADRDAQRLVRESLVQFRKVTGDLPSGLPAPDGADRIHFAGRAVRVAQENYQKANKRLFDFLTKGIVPDGLAS